MLFVKRQLPLIIAFIMGVTFAVQYYVPHGLSEGLFTTVNDWMIVVAGFAYFLGLASLSHLHLTRIRRGGEGWGFSLVLLASIAATFVAGCYALGETTQPGSAFGWIYNNMQVSLSQTVFSILAFFIASVAFRSFKARTLDAGLLLAAALIVMLGRVPVGQFIPGIGEIASWIMNVPNMAARRGVMIGVALGTIAMSLKIIVGIERAYLGGEGE